MRPPQRHCAAPGCYAMQRSRTFSSYCSAHRKALRRHGSALQVPITLHHLGPHLAAVKGWQRRNADSPAWAMLARRWEALADRARSILAGRDAGHPFNKHGARAAELLLQVVDAATPEKVTVQALALYLLRDATPSLFPEDSGFLFTLARRVRKLSPMAVAHYWNHKTQRMTAVYNDPPPKVTAVLGQWLAECFGSAGLQLASLQRQRAQQEVQQETQERHRLADALGALQ